jgi:hypothetical protein
MASGVARKPAATGDDQAATDAFALVYDQLRRLGTARMAAEKPGHTLNRALTSARAWLREALEK